MPARTNGMSKVKERKMPAFRVKQERDGQWICHSSRPEGIGSYGATAEEAIREQERLVRAFDRWCVAIGAWKPGEPLPSVNDPAFWDGPPGPLTQGAAE